MLDVIMSSTPVKIIGLVIIALSFVVLIKNPGRSMLDAMKSGRKVKHDPEETEGGKEPEMQSTEPGEAKK